MKPGDLVVDKNSHFGLFIGMRTFENGKGGKPYTCAEVMWLDRTAPNGNKISTIQKDLIKVAKEDS